MAEFKKGDRVRIVTEGEITHVTANGDSFDIGDSGGFYFKDAPEIVSVEKVAEVFEPGAVVRHKQDGWVRALSKDGYVVISGSAPGTFFPYGSLGFHRSHFNSNDWEKVDLG